MKLKKGEASGAKLKIIFRGRGLSILRFAKKNSVLKGLRFGIEQRDQAATVKS